MFGLGATELILIVVAILLLFGARKIPELARSLGKARGEFQRGAGGDGEDNERRPGKDTEA